ncbi:UNVERIFIED_CONTAM: protein DETOXIFICATION 30 [Sesamum latifolium]|uniref:Protein DETOXIFICATION 30 n=1 Tax=Sesamum latifolium TaxID=2727402 RepID=A0AAW2UW44_9LAMI
MIPQLYAYALNFPIAKFLQAQSNIMAMAWISVVALGLHILFSWLLMPRGAERFVVVPGGGAADLHIQRGCGEAWTGFPGRHFRIYGVLSDYRLHQQ